ncbi:MAG: YfhO family protein [Myxococcota bacterium]|nr:YfhO family protein [Myxococcota bacterium]
MRGLARRPAATGAAGTLLVLGMAWRRFLDGSHSPFSGDVEQYHYPVTLELARAWSDGRLPLWTDRVYLGFPFFADPQTAAWYPGTLLVVALGPHFGYIAFLFVHSVLAAAGATGLARSHGCAWPTAWVSGLIVSLSGYFAHEIRHPGLFAILAWVPTWLWATHRIFSKPTPARVALAAVPVAMMIFAGTLQVLFGAVIVYAFYVAGLGLDARRERGGRNALRAVAASLAAPLLGLCVAAVVALPTLAHFPHTARALGMTYAFGSMGSVPPLQLLSTFFESAPVLLGGAADLDATSLYLGALTLPLALVALLGVRRILPVALTLCLIAIAVIAMGEHGSLHPLLYSWMPEALGILRGMGRALGPGTVCVALLAGLGLQRLGDPTSGLQRVFGALLLIAAAAHGLILWGAREPLAFESLGGILVLAAALCLWIASQRRPGILQPGLAALVVLDLFTLGPLGDVLEAAPPPPSHEHVAGSMPVLADLDAGLYGNPEERMLLLGFGPRNLPLMLGPDGVGGYNPLVTLRYLDFVSLLENRRLFDRRPLNRFVHLEQPQQLDAALVDAAAIRFVISPAPLQFEGLRLLEQYPKHPLRQYNPYLYENPDALPRAYLAYRTQLARHNADLERLVTSRFDGHSVTVVEAEAEPLDGPAEIAPVEMIRERPEVLRFEVAPEHSAVLVVADAWYPGWKAWVDGNESPVLRVNGFFRGVALPAGARQVEMRFEPWSFRVGAFVSIAAAVLLAALLAWRSAAPRR